VTLIQFSGKNPSSLFVFKTEALKFSLFLGQCVITGLSTGYCFNGPVSKRLNLSQNLFRATIIATLQKIGKKKKNHCSKFGKTQHQKLLKTINQIPTEHLD
jgi:hypothetical protein